MPSFPLRFSLSLTLAYLVGCSSSEPIPQVTPDASVLVRQEQFQLPQTAQILQLGPESIDITLKVYAAGRLAKFGHNHIITATQASGLLKLHPDMTKTGFILLIPVSGLMVDQPQARAKAGPDFTKIVSAKDSQATSRNMLGPKVLDVENHPFIEAATVKLWGDPPNITAELEVTIKQITQRITAPILLSQSDGIFTATGRLRLSQQAFDITPFSILGGAIAVEDSLELLFRITLHPNMQ